MAKKYKRYVTIGRDKNGKRIEVLYGDSKPELENIRDYWIEASRVSNPSCVLSKIIPFNG